MRKIAYLVVMLIMGGLALVVGPAIAQPRLMNRDIFTPISKGYDLLQAGEYEAAEFEFRTALKKDPYNPFALNNLAAIAVQKGKLKEAMAYLKDAEAHSEEYYQKVEQTCFVGDQLYVVKPVKGLSSRSHITPIIKMNIDMLSQFEQHPPQPEPPNGKKKRKKKI